MMTTGGENSTWFFYRSTLNDLSNENLSWDYIGSVPGPDTQDDHQTLQFLRQGDIHGPLYLAGARSRILSSDRDRIDLYRVVGATENFEPGQSIDTPVIMLSEEGGSAQIVRALRAGADDHMSKPVDIDVLVDWSQRSASILGACGSTRRLVR